MFIDLIHPAFFNKYIRNHKETTTFFHDVKFETINFKDEDYYFIFGRIVKDTNIEREQVYVEGELLEDHDSLQNSPSSIFALSLVDHRLFFIKEHKDSPTVDNFKATTEYFIKKARKELIDKTFKESKVYNSNKITKRALEEKYPSPDLNIISLSSGEELDGFIATFKSVDNLTLNLVKPNDEGDCNDFFKSWRDTSTKKLQTPNSKLVFSKHNKTLPHSEVANLAKEAIEDGNIIINIKGKDLNKDTINGTPDDFKLTVPIDDDIDSPKFIILKMYTKFWELVSNGLISEPRITNLSKVKERVDMLYQITKKLW
jgi:hypothetical protein